MLLLENDKEDVHLHRMYEEILKRTNQKGGEERREASWKGRFKEKKERKGKERGREKVRKSGRNSLCCERDGEAKNEIMQFIRYRYNTSCILHVDHIKITC